MSCGESGLELKPSSGGLVTALSPVLSQRRGLWIGWIGQEETLDIRSMIREASGRLPYDIHSVPISSEEESLYYHGFSNAGLWPLFHDLLGFCSFDLAQWRAYRKINRRFAEESRECLRPDDLVWIHDYQLIFAASEMRKAGVTNRLAFFLHIPFPPFALLRRLPWWRDLVAALLQHDLIGFQTHQDFANFQTSVRQLQPENPLEIGGDGLGRVTMEGHTAVVGAFPISIDFDEFDHAASTPEVAAEAASFAELLGTPTLVMGLDRLDYTKGIPERFLAFEHFLERHTELHRKVSLYQCVIPSRTQVPDYRDLKRLLDELVGRINGRFYRPGWLPIHYAYRSMSRTELLGRYRACDICLVTPLRDGMNLVAKEYCAACVEDNGVLILSEFAGAAEELGKHALLVNPYDQEGLMLRLYQAITMPREERSRRMAGLRKHLRQNTVHRWVERFLGTLA